MKHTNKTLLGKGIKYLAMALPLSAIGPVILYSAFNNQQHPLYIPVLILGLIACIAAVFLMFKGIGTLVKSLFD
jgi:hypothetical protein